MAKITAQFIQILLKHIESKDKPKFYLSDLNKSINMVNEIELFYSNSFSYLCCPLALSLENRLSVFNFIEGDKSMIVDAIRGKEFDCFLESLKENNIKSISKIYVEYQSEPARDQGGPVKEFLSISLQSVSSDTRLFTKTDQGRFWFNSNSKESMFSFKAVGILMGYLVRNNIAVKPRFDKLLYKKLIGEEILESDIYEINPSALTIFTNLRRIRDAEQDISALGYTFTILIKGLNGYEEVPIVEGGKDILVTNVNLDYYIASYVDYVANKSIQKQFEAFSEGFHNNCLGFAKIFTADELDIIISGRIVTNWSSMIDSIVFDKFSASSKTPMMFRELFEKLSDTDRSRLLWFISGLSTEPLNGFGQLGLRIVRGGDASLLPVAHTCIREMVLPEYKTLAEMERSIKICIDNAEGFGFI